MEIRLVKAAVVAAVLMGVLVVAASAVGPYSSSASGFYDGTNYTPDTVIVSATGASGVCTVHDTTGFYQWDLTAVDDGAVVGSVVVTLTVSFATVPVASNIGLYSTDSDSLPSTVVAKLSEVSVPTDPSVGDTVVIPSSVALVNYIQTALTDNTATLAVRWSTCNGETSTPNIMFQSSAQMGLNRPTAVTVATFRAADSGPNWPLIAGLMGVLGVALSVSIVLRRRYTVRQPNS